MTSDFRDPARRRPWEHGPGPAAGLGVPPRHTAEQERALARRRLELTPGEWRACPERAALVESMLPLAFRLAGRFRRPPLGDDAIGLAHLALLRAVDGFDPGRGCRLSTYVGRSVHLALIRGGPEVVATVRVPAYLRGKARPGPGWDAAVEAAGRAAGVRPLSGVDDGRLVVAPADPGDPEARRAEDLARVARALRLIPEREAAAIRAYHLSGGSPSLRDVGMALGVTKGRAGQLVEAGKARLRRLLGGEGRAASWAPPPARFPDRRGRRGRRIGIHEERPTPPFPDPSARAGGRP